MSLEQLKNWDPVGGVIMEVTTGPHFFTWLLGQQTEVLKRKDSIYFIIINIITFVVYSLYFMLFG